MREVLTPINIEETDKDEILATLRTYLTSTFEKEHYELELRGFAQSLSSVVNNEENANKMAFVSENLTPVQRARLVGLLFLYGSDLKGSLAGEFLNNLSADQLTPEMLISGPHEQDEGFNTKRPVRRFSQTGWRLEGTRDSMNPEKKRVALALLDQTSELLHVVQGATFADLSLDQLKDFCRAYFARQTPAADQTIEEVLKSLEPDQQQFFLGCAALYSTNLRCETMQKLYDKIKYFEEAALDAIFAGVAKTSLAVNKVMARKN